VIDAALLLDWGFERECDAVLAVVAPREQSVARLVRSRGWSEAQARERLAAARSNEGFAALADETVMNDGHEAAAVAAARAAVARLVARRAGAMSPLARLRALFARLLARVTAGRPPGRARVEA
jgi:dephospho-CoA kinase